MDKQEYPFFLIYCNYYSYVGIQKQKVNKNFVNVYYCYQTGSGKTFTITGGAERYVDRGIIPRTLSYVFEQISKVSFICLSFLCYLNV